MTPNFWPTFDREVGREQPKSGRAPWTMLRRLELLNEVPQQDLQIWLGWVEVLEWPLTHECWHRALPGNLDKSPVATHFYWYFSTQPGWVPQLLQYATFLCYLISKLETSPNFQRIPTRWFMLASSTLTINGVSSPYLLSYNNVRY